MPRMPRLMESAMLYVKPRQPSYLFVVRQTSGTSPSTKKTAVSPGSRPGLWKKILALLPLTPWQAGRLRVLGKRRDPAAGDTNTGPTSASVR